MKLFGHITRVTNGNTTHTMGACLFLGSVGVDIQWRGYDSRDDGVDPWMLSLTLLAGKKAKCWYLINPRMEISPTARLSLALRGRDYWCDDSWHGEPYSISQFRMRQEARLQAARTERFEAWFRDGEIAEYEIDS